MKSGLSILALLLAAGPLQGAVYVSPAGADANSGTAAAPVQSLARALELGAGSEIIMAEGQYLNNAALVIPAGTTIRGSQVPTAQGWLHGGNQTIILNSSLAGQASLTLQAAPSAGSPSARLEWMRIVGGFVSVELQAGASLFEVELSGGSSSAVFIGSGEAGRPSILDRVEITGGQGGIRVAATGSAEIRSTLTRNTLGAGADIRGTGTVLVRESSFQTASLQGCVVTDNPNVTIENSNFRRNSGDGLRLVRSGATVRGCFFELNENAVVMQRADSPIVENCTIVTSRQHGIVMELSNGIVARNILAANSGYGVREIQQDIPPGSPTPPPITEILDRNLFWQNSLGNVLDEDDRVLNTAPEIATATNRQPSVGNLVVDPLFRSTATGNYRLAPSSPAIDAVAATSVLATDIDKATRQVGYPGIGLETTGTIDLGAFEHQGPSRVVDGMGGLYYDSSLVPDTDDPDTQVEVRRGPTWEVNPAAVYKPVKGNVVPGRGRMTSLARDTFGFLYRRADDIEQPNGTIARVRSTISSPGSSSKPTFRLRTNWYAIFHAAQMMTVDGPQESGPTPGGRVYEMYIDLYQGAYRSSTAQALPSIRYLYNLDMVDFDPFSLSRPPLDLNRLEVDYLDRGTFEAQFTEEVARWSFATDAEGWIAEAPVAGFGEPIMRHSAPRQALEIAQVQDGSYRAWAAPPVDFTAGGLYMVRLRVSSDRPEETGTAFRVRVSDFEFNSTTEIQTGTSPGSQTVPIPAGRDYVLFGRIPDSVPDARIRLYWDLLGFGGTSRGGSLFLEEATILSIP